MLIRNHVKVAIAIVTFLLINSYGGYSGVPPRPSGPVADFADIINNDTELKINTLARKLWVEARFGLLLVTLDSLGDMPADAFTAQLCRDWKVWTKDNPEGAVMLFTVNPPRLIIEPGKGSVGYLSTGVISAFTDTIEWRTMPADSASGKLPEIAAAIAALVTGAKQIPPEALPAFTSVNVAGKGRFVALVKLIALLIPPGCGILLLLFVTAARSKSARATLLRSAREPFGNVLSGDGFGGGLLRRTDKKL